MYKTRKDAFNGEYAYLESVGITRAAVKYGHDSDGEFIQSRGGLVLVRFLGKFSDIDIEVEREVANIEAIANGAEPPPEWHDAQDRLRRHEKEMSRFYDAYQPWVGLRCKCMRLVVAVQCGGDNRFVLHENQEGEFCDGSATIPRAYERIPHLWPPNYSDCIRHGVADHRLSRYSSEISIDEAIRQAQERCGGLCDRCASDAWSEREMAKPYVRQGSET